MKAMVATRKGLFELIRLNEGWKIDQISFLGEPVSMCLFDQRDGAIFVALNLGHFGVKMHRRGARTRDWTEIGVPSYPPQPPKTEADSSDVEWKLKQIWSLEAGAKNESGVLWAGTHPGGLFRSNDGGNRWELIESLWQKTERLGWFGGGYDVPGIHSICIDPLDSRHVTLGISCGGVWQTKDAGETWALSAKGMHAAYMPPELAENENTQDPHLIVQCAAAPDQFWCQHHNGIWRSTDNAASWQQITPPHGISDFGFAVAVHPKDPNTAWFVPAVADQRRVPTQGALSVSRTRDGGKTFESLREGLPQLDCYDLIYRHGLAVSDDGQTLLMASTTGNLWVSEDAGDSWQAISFHLPPVYAVKFC